MCSSCQDSGTPHVVEAPEPEKPAKETLHSQTFHRRQLAVPPAVPFSSQDGAGVSCSLQSSIGMQIVRHLNNRHDAGRKMFKDALMQGTLEGFFELIEQFRYWNSA